MSWDTYHSRQVTLKLLDDARETSAGLVEELPASPHGGAVPSRRSEFRGLCDVALGLVPELVLEEDAELEGMGEEESEERRGAHYDCFLVE